MRWRLLVGAVSVAGHGLVLFALLPARPPPPRTFETGPTTMVSLVAAPPPPKVEAPKTPAEPAASPAPAAVRPSPATPRPHRALARPSRAPPVMTPVPAADSPPGDTADEVSEGELAGAATAGSGSGLGSGSGGGGTCDMTRWLQDKLRKDRLVQTAVAQAHRGKAIRVWNGDWVRRADQDGAGLAAVREAMMWEIAFAPAACRTKLVHGLVMISLADGPGAARLVVGSGDWRWSDLLSLKRR